MWTPILQGRPASHFVADWLHGDLSITEWAGICPLWSKHVSQIWICFSFLAKLLPAPSLLDILNILFTIMLSLTKEPILQKKKADTDYHGINGFIMIITTQKQLALEDCGMEY